MAFDTELQAVRELRGMGAVSVEVGSVKATFAPLQVIEQIAPPPAETPEQRKAREEREMFLSSGG